MAELPERDAALLLDMLLAAQDARSFVEAIDRRRFSDSRLHQHATIHALAVIGEAAGRISAGTRTAHPEIPWRDITGMRNRLVHGYTEIDLDLVWEVASDRLPPLISILRQLLPPDQAGGG